jgi:hypothetical protein
MTSQEWITIIGAISIAMVQVITAWRSSVKKERIAYAANDKLDAIHTLTNSRMAEVHAALSLANERVVALEKIVKSLTPDKIRHES